MSSITIVPDVYISSSFVLVWASSKSIIIFIDAFLDKFSLLLFNLLFLNKQVFHRTKQSLMHYNYLMNLLVQSFEIYNNKYFFA
jgi:hypothetical protein